MTIWKKTVTQDIHVVSNRSLDNLDVTDMAISCSILTGSKLAFLKAALGVIFGPSSECGDEGEFLKI